MYNNYVISVRLRLRVIPISILTITSIHQSHHILKAVVQYATSQYGKVDILVNGAAGNFLAEAKSLTPKGFKTVMDIDAQGTFNMCHAVYPAMSENGGSIINISMTLHYGGESYSLFMMYVQTLYVIVFFN